MKAYVIVQGWGCYSNRTEVPQWVFLDLTAAQEFMAKLEAVRGLLVENNTRESLVAMRVAYLSLTGDEFDENDDWALHTVDLLDATSKPGATSAEVDAYRLRLRKEDEFLARSALKLPNPSLEAPCRICGDEGHGFPVCPNG